MVPGIDILKVVAAQIGSQWIDIYQSLASANEREVSAFSKGYSADHQRAYAALQRWTICDVDANLAKLINALHHHRRIDVVEKIRYIMEDGPQVGSANSRKYKDAFINLLKHFLNDRLPLFLMLDFWREKNTGIFSDMVTLH